MAKYNRGFAFDTEQEAIKALQEEGRKLKYIAIKVWRKYLGSYQPKSYVRTRDSQKAIKLGQVKRVGNDFVIELTFENDLAYHDSVIGKDQPQGHSIMLISNGWTASNLERKIGMRQRFTRYKGFNYLGQVEKEYRKRGHEGVLLEIQWKGEDYKVAKRPFTK